MQWLICLSWCRQTLLKAHLLRCGRPNSDVDAIAPDICTEWALIDEFGIQDTLQLNACGSVRTLIMNRVDAESMDKTSSPHQVMFALTICLLLTCNIHCLSRALPCDHRDLCLHQFLQPERNFEHMNVPCFFAILDDDVAIVWMNCQQCN